MSRTQMTMPPDAGSTNSGQTAIVGRCGRGIQRTGDIRHVGDISGGKLQTIALAPGTNSFSVAPDSTSTQAGPPGATTTPTGFDSQADGFTAYAGGDASGEGFDGFSGKNGLEN